MSTEMKKLIIGGTEYEIVDDAGRTRITALEQGGGSGTGLTQTEKDLILELFEKAAYAENDASTAFNALSTLWTGYSVTWNGTGYTKSNSAASVSTGATFTSTITANTGFTITDVAVTMGGNTVQGAWSNGTVTIPNVTGDIVITVTTSQITVSSISAVYTQSGTVYNTDNLDSLKSDLVVTATFLDSSTGVIAAEDYTLSGTLTVGTSTITVSYGGKIATFNVAVTKEPNYTRDGLQGYWTFDNVQDGYFGELTNLVDNGDLKAEALYAHNVSGGVPFAGVKDGEFISTTSRVSSAATKHCPTAIRVSTVANHPLFYTAYPYSVEWYGKFVGGSFNGTEYGTQFQYATASASEPVLINTRNNADPTTSAFNVGGQGTTVTVQNGSYKTYGAAGAGNNTITHANMSPENYHHYVITVAKTSIKIYVDGELIGEGTATNNNNASAAYGLLLGMYTSIKMVRVYNKILSAEEVATNYSDVAPA